MASSGVTFTIGSTTYVADLETLRTFSETYATEVETARGGESNLDTRLDGMPAYAGMTSNLAAAGYRVTGAGDAVGSQDYTTLSQVNALIIGGGSPSAIDITALGIGTATAGQLIRINSGGSAVEGFTNNYVTQNFTAFHNWNLWGN